MTGLIPWRGIDSGARDRAQRRAHGLPRNTTWTCRLVCGQWVTHIWRNQRVVRTITRPGNTPFPEVAGLARQATVDAA